MSNIWVKRWNLAKGTEEISNRPYKVLVKLVRNIMERNDKANVVTGSNGNVTKAYSGMGCVCVCVYMCVCV